MEKKVTGDVELSLCFRMGVAEEEAPVLLGVGVTRADTAGDSRDEELSGYRVLVVVGDADTR